MSAGCSCQRTPKPSTATVIPANEAAAHISECAQKNYRLSPRGIDARVIFQGDTKQLQAVGRGQPLAMLERELGFGMHVGRIDVTRRQLTIDDKRLSRELSSGDAARFCAAMERLIERGAIRHGGLDDAVQAILANRNAAQPVETIVLSSTHRLAIVLNPAG